MPAKITVNLRSYYYLVISCLLIILTISGCSSNVTQQQAKGGNNIDKSKSDENFSVPLPTSLLKHLVSSDKLSAVLIVDKGTKTEKTVQLTIDHATNKVNGTVDNLTAETHSFDIIYYIDSEGKLVEVATATQRVTVAAGPETTPTPITFAGSDLRYTDSDGDGLTNLAELEIGTKYDSAADKPITDLLRSSQNYLLSDTQGITPTDGKTTAVGESKSANYTLN